MFSNPLAFLDIWTTPKVDSATNADNTITIAEARGAALVWTVIGIVAGPFVHRKLGMNPLF